MKAWLSWLAQVLATFATAFNVYVWVRAMFDPPNAMNDNPVGITFVWVCFLGSLAACYLIWSRPSPISTFKNKETNAS